MKPITQPAISTIIFDWGKTFHDYHLDTFFSWLERNFSIPRHFFWGMFSRYPDGLLYHYECGQPTDEFLGCVRKKTAELLERLKHEEGKIILPAEFSDEEFLEHWNMIIDPSPPAGEKVELLRKLKRRGYGVYILSNTNKEHYSYLKEGDVRCGYRFLNFRDVFEIIDRFFASCDDDIQCRKIRPGEGSKEDCEKIFRKALAIIKSKPEETVFIDDILDYVNVFRSMDGHGIHCTGNWTKVEAELYELGVIW